MKEGHEYPKGTITRKKWDWLTGIEVIPPKAAEYDAHKSLYVVAKGVTIRLNERQYNFAMSLYNHPDWAKYLCMIEAGYEWRGRWRKSTTLTNAMRDISSRANNLQSADVTKAYNALKAGDKAATSVDGDWVLNEQVSLYESCKRDKDNTNAIRLLNDISMHVQVDSRVSNRVVVENAVDYAALLNAAEARVSLEFKDENVIDAEAFSIEEESLGVTEDTDGTPSIDTTLAV